MLRKRAVSHPVSTSKVCVLFAALAMCLLLAATVAASDAKWFVICGSYPESQQQAAMQRMQQLQGAAPDVSVIHTTGYHNLRDGLFAVVLGPYPKSYAMQRLQYIKAYVPDAYVKAGW